MSVTAVYAGSFDPPTVGHEWMIAQAAQLFPKLVVAIGTNPDKKYSNPLDRRLGWLRELCRPFPNAQVTSFENLFLADYAKRIGASIIVRGIRNEADYEFERAMRHVNGDLYPGLVSVFLMPPRELAEVSSSMVKGMIGPAGWQGVVQRYVPACVFRSMVSAHA